MIRLLTICQNWSGGSASLQMQCIVAVELTAVFLLAKATLLFKDEQYGHKQLPQFGRMDELHLRTG